MIVLFILWQFNLNNLPAIIFSNANIDYLTNSLRARLRVGNLNLEFVVFHFFVVIIEFVFIEFVFIIVVNIFFVITVFGIIAFFSFFGCVELFFHFFLTFGTGFDDGFGSFDSTIKVIRNQKVIKNGTRFDLPQIQTDSTKVRKFINSFIFFVIWVVNFWVYPWSFIVRVSNLFGFPFSFKFWVVNHWSFPFTVHFLVPIFWFFGIWIWNIFSFIIPTLWFGIIRIFDFFNIYPIARFGLFWVFDLFWREHVPIFF